MNHIPIKQPRFHDNTILVAAWKVGDDNAVTIDWHEYDGLTFYLTGEQIRKYPLTYVKNKHGFESKMYVVPLSSLDKLELTL